MRERLAELLAALTAVLVIGLAAIFGIMRNMPATVPEVVPATQTAAAAPGRAAFERLGCAGCHSVAGKGNPRSPLDGVGTRRSRDALRHWTVAADEVAPQLTASVARMKRTYADLPEEELHAIVEFLASLKADR